MSKQRARKASDEAPEENARAHGEADSQVNGAAGAAGDGAAPSSTEERMRRAEEMVDRMAERVGNAAGWLGHGLLRLAARAREEAEDIWAEARSLSRGDHAPKGAPGEREGQPPDGPAEAGR
jgi:hypothetical protein